MVVRRDNSIIVYSSSSRMIALVALTLTIALATGASAAPIRSSDPSTFFGGDAADIQDYLDWVATVDYKDTYFLPSSSGDAADGAAVHWSINEEQGIVELAVAVRATGWLGFGLSENGGMTGSDMLIFEAADPDTVKDAYVKEERYPLFDDCQSWDFVSSSVDTEFLIVEVRREIDTLDNQDKLIHKDADLRTAPQRIIAAWGDSPNMGYHGAKNARSTIRWYGQGEDESSKFHTMMEDQTVGSFRINIENYKVPPDLTTYRSFCVTVDELKEHNADTPFDDGITVVGLEAIVTSRFVHHFSFFASSTTDHLYDYPCWDSRAHPDLIYAYAPGMYSVWYFVHLCSCAVIVLMPCDCRRKPSNLSSSPPPHLLFSSLPVSSYLFTNKIGEPPLIMPEGVGITVGGETGYKSFRLEIHYFNEVNVRDQYDSSGIDLHFSLKPPMYEAGMTAVGDPFIRLLDQPVGQGLTEHIIECNRRCSLVDWGDTPSVTVYRENLHMHLTGTAMYSEHYRRGRGLIRKSRAEYYDFK